MSRSEQPIPKKKPFAAISVLFVLIVFISIIIGLFFYSQSVIRVDAPEPNLGEKVIISLPKGKTVFTYENLLIEENGKLYYQGERNTIDLTGGEVVYENWE